MISGTNKHHRRSIRLKGYDYSQPGAYFVTVCTHRWANLFGDVLDGKLELNRFGRIVKALWLRIPDIRPHIGVDEFVVMPNHVHAIAIIEDVGAIHELPLHDARRQRRSMLLPKVVGYFKMNTAKHINRARNTPGMPVWQRNYYDHVVRDKVDLERIRQYIRDNPAQWDIDRENPVNA